MPEYGKNYDVKQPSAPEKDLKLSKEIEKAEDRLEVLAQVVGADYGLKARFGKLGGGSFFNPEENSITLDPQILLDNKEYLAEFVAGHEGGHRAITRGLEQIGMPREKAMELYKKIGFGYLSNCLEDCADNRWVGETFAKFKEDSKIVYAEQFKNENAILTTPEIDQLIGQLGYVPKFVSFGSELIRDWAAGELSQNLAQEVKEALDKCLADARQGWETIPGIYAKEGERLKQAKERFRLIYEKLWPEFEKLVKMDINEEKLRQLANELNKQKSAGGEKGKGGGGLSEELSKELVDKIEENLREQLNKLAKELEKLKEQMDKAGAKEEKDKIAKQMAEMLSEKESLEKGEKNVAPWDKISDELKQKLREIFDKLPEAVKKQLAEAAKKQLEELDDKLIKETRGKLSKDASPPTHEEIRTAEKKEAAERETDEKNKKAREQEKIEDEKLSAKLKQQLEGELGEYEKIYQEIAPLADELYDRIHQIFLPQRHPRWQKGHPTGHRLDLAKVMQFQADRSLYDKIWERKTIPQKIDYRFTLLVDLSGSMQGEKTEQTFRGVILLAEVLNRLGVKAQILGFQDAPILYKDFNEELGPMIRKKMAVMRKEPSNQGQHNQANWNSDGYCLREASGSLAKQKGKDNFLVVFSDGEPAPDEAHDGPEFDLKKVVAEIRKNTKQKLIGVGLGPETAHVKDYYPTSLPNLNLKQMPQLLGKLLEDMIKYPSKYK